jgi:GT2 family glycosyltransferase
MSGRKHLLPDVSVVIPTRNRPELLKEAIDALGRQSGVAHDEVEVIVVDDGSYPPAASTLRGQVTPFPLRILRQPHCGVASARNAGWVAASGDLVLFVDDDVALSQDAVAVHRALHASNPSAVVLGAVSSEAARDRTPWNAYEDALKARKYRELAQSIKPSGIPYGGNFSVRRKYLEAAGGFDQTLVSNQDVDLGFRLLSMGLTFVFEPSAVGVHRGGGDLPTWKQNYSLRGRMDVAIYRDRGYAGGLPSLVACYHDRHVLSRAALRLALLTRGNERRVVAAGVAGGLATHRLGLSRLSRLSMSVAANVLYWAGVRDGLHGNRQLWELVRRTRHHTARPYQLDLSQSQT